MLWFLSMAILHVSAYDFEVDRIYYNILPDGLSVEVTVGDEKYNVYGDQSDIVIPEKVGYNGKQYTVTAIGRIAFCNCGDMGTIDLPATINTFGSDAFYGCHFKKVFIHDLTAYCNIDNKGTMPPFYNYHNDSTNGMVKYASGLLLLNNEPVKDLSTLDNRCKQIPDYAFYGLSTLEDATLPDSVGSIGELAFYYCKNLKKISIGNKVEVLLAKTFLGCKKINDFIVRDGDNSLAIESIYGSFLPSNFEADCSFENVYLGRYLIVKGSQKTVFGQTSGIKNVICNTKNGISELSFKRTYKYDQYEQPVHIENFIIGPKAKCDILCVYASKVYCFGDVKYNHKYGTPDYLYVLSKDIVPKEYAWEDRIKTLIDIKGFDLQNGAEFEYGDTPDITTSALVNHVPDMQAEINVDKCFGAGKHTEGLPITLSNDIWTAEIFYPWSYTVNKAPLTVIAENVERPYGSEEQDFTVSYFGFKNGEDESVLTKPVSISTTAKKDSPVGTYPIVPFGGLADNYDLSYERGVLTIVKATQTIAWNDELPAKATVGTKIKLEATTTSGLPVSFKSSDESVANVSVIGGEQYLICKKAGEVDVIAYQEGNKNYEAAPNETRNLTIVKTAQTITWLSELPTETTVGTKIKLEATATSGLPVSFKSSDESVASISYMGGAYYLTCKKAGNVDITACQEGDNNYSAAPEDVHNLTVVRTAQTISWVSELPTETTVGTKIKLEATATSGLPVSFKSSDESVASISSTGGAYYLICKKAGYVDVTAYQDGDDKYEAAPYEEHNLRVVKIAQTIDWKGELPAEAHVGTKIKLEATATSGLTVAFKSSDESVASISVTGGVCYLICKKTGNVDVTAYQEGDDKYEAAPDEIRNITVIPSSGIVDAALNLDGSEKIYDTNGNLLEKCQRGVNIIRYPDGRTKKVAIK